MQTAAQESDLYAEVVDLGKEFVRRYPLLIGATATVVLPNTEHIAAYIANTPPVEDDESE